MKNISRRQLFKAVGISSVFFALPKSLLATTRKPLIIPPLLTNKRGKPIILTLGSIQKPLDGTHYVEVWGFNGNYLGPTIKLEQGDFAKLNWNNSLDETVSIHIQGLQASAELAGNISRKLNPNKSWSPVIPIKQNAATCYYQACTFTQSAYQNYRGLVGMCFIEGKAPLPKYLPKEYGFNDIPLILQDLSLDGKGTQLFSEDTDYFYGDRLFVNGQASPYLKVASEVIRLRLLNASVSRCYNLSFDDKRHFKILASDQGFLSQPINTQYVQLAPGERVEILVDLRNGKNTTLMAGEHDGFLDKIANLFSPNTLKENVVLELRTNGLVAAFAEEQHFKFIDPSLYQRQKIYTERQFNIDPTEYTINGQHLHLQRPDVIAKLGTTERWKIKVTEPMAFRLQGARFLVEKLNGQSIPLEQRSWKDTVWIKENTQILIQFNSASSIKYPFTFGAAALSLADRGCLGLLVVKP